MPARSLRPSRFDGTGSLPPHHPWDIAIEKAGQ